MADADSKVSALTEVTALTTSDELLINDGGTSKRITAANSGLFPKPNGGAYRGARVYDAGNQSVTQTTDVAIAFDTESRDTDAIHDNSTNNTRLTVPAGVTEIRLIGNLQIDGMGIDKLIQLRFYKNGSAVYDGLPTNRINSISGTNWHQLFSDVLTVVAVDYLEFFIFHGDTTSRNVIGGNDATWFAMEIVT